MNATIIALDDNELDARAAGKIVWWALRGETEVARLADALMTHGSSAIAPEAPTAIVALHRAVEDTARLNKSKIHPIRRGAWAIVSRPEVGTDAIGDKTLVYGVRTEAWVDGETIHVEGEHAEVIRERFDVARKYLSPADVGGWLCAKVERLGGVPLRPSGGVYFIPRDVVAKWDRLSKAVQAASMHKLHSIPALQTADAVDAILSAITEDVTSACAKITEEIGNVGPRALASRQEDTKALLDKVSRYEGILGKRLDALREAIEETRSATAVAMLAASSEATS